jgi:ankyrin repeat protein
LNYQGQDKWTFLHIATNEGNYAMVKILLQYGAHPDPESVTKRTALHIACMRGHLNIVKILIEYKAGIDVTDIEANTPAHL